MSRLTGIGSTVTGGNPFARCPPPPPVCVLQQLQVTYPSNGMMPVRLSDVLTHCHRLTFCARKGQTTFCSIVTGCSSVHRRQANPLKDKNLFNQDLEDNSGKRKATSSNPFMRRPKAKN